MYTLTHHDYTAPSHWASAIMNGDTSGLSDEECEMVNLTIKHIALAIGNAYCVGCEELGFHTRKPTYAFGRDLAGDFSVYSFCAEFEVVNV